MYSTVSFERLEGGSDATECDHGPVEVEGDHRLTEAAPELTEQMVAGYRYLIESE